MAVLVSDSFNRADSTTTLGTTDSYNGGSPYTWGLYNGGVWGIKTNQAYNSTSHADNTAYVDVGQSDNITIALTLNNANIYTYGIAFRIQDANNMFRAYATGGALKIDRKTAGTWTNIMNFGGTYTFPMSASITLSGSTITFNIGGTAKSSVTDTSFQTATAHGMYINNSTSVYLDNFEIDGTATGGTGTTYTGSGNAQGTSNVTANGSFIANATGSAQGIANVSAVANAILSAMGTAQGTSTVSGNEIKSYAASGGAQGQSNVSANELIIYLTSGAVNGQSSVSANETIITHNGTVYSESGPAQGVTEITVNERQILSAKGTAQGVSSVSVHDLVVLMAGGIAQGYSTVTVVDTSMQIIGRIELKGQRDLYVYLKGQRDLTINLKGSL